MIGYKPAGHGYSAIQYASDTTGGVGNIIHEGECVSWQSLTDTAENVVIKTATANDPKFVGVLIGKDNVDLRRLDSSGNPTAAVGFPLSLAGPGDETLVKIVGTCQKNDLLYTTSAGRMSKCITDVPLQANMANNATQLRVLVTDLPDGVCNIAVNGLLRVGADLFSIGAIGSTTGSPAYYPFTVTYVGGGTQAAHTALDPVLVVGTWNICGQALQACATTLKLIQATIMKRKIIIT